MLDIVGTEPDAQQEQPYGASDSCTRGIYTGFSERLSYSCSSKYYIFISVVNEVAVGNARCLMDKSEYTYLSRILEMRNSMGAGSRLYQRILLVGI